MLRDLSPLVKSAQHDVNHFTPYEIIEHRFCGIRIDHDRYAGCVLRVMVSGRREDSAVGSPFGFHARLLRSCCYSFIAVRWFAYAAAAILLPADPACCCIRRLVLDVWPVGKTLI